MYVDLKLFRLEHNNMFQSELGEILGIGQSVVSRMEKQFTELNEVQYKKLCERFGKEEVQKYQTDNPLQNAVSASRAQRRVAILEGTDTHPNQNVDTPKDIAGLIAVVRSQQEEIARLNQRVADLTEIIIEKVYG